MPVTAPVTDSRYHQPFYTATDAFIVLMLDLQSFAPAF